MWNSIETAWRLPRRRLDPTGQVLLHVEDGKDVAALRDVAEAQPGAVLRVRGPRCEVPASPIDAGPETQQAHDRLQQRGLADAVAPEAGARALGTVAS